MMTPLTARYVMSRFWHGDGWSRDEAMIVIMVARGG